MSEEAAGVTAAQLRRALQDVVADKTGYPVEMVDPSMDLEADLGVDSIKRVQVLGAVQERFPSLPSLGPEQLGTLRTLDQIVPAAQALAIADRGYVLVTGENRFSDSGKAHVEILMEAGR